MQEWAEVHRLFHRESCSKAEIADRLGMSRTTVYRLLALRESRPHTSVAPGIVARPPQGVRFAVVDGAGEECEEMTKELEEAS